MGTPCDWRGLSNVQCDEGRVHRVVWWRLVGAVPMCPPVSPYEGASVVHSPHTMRVFLIWKRRYADVRAGTQAPPLRFRLGRLRVGRLVSFGWIACGRLMPFGWIVRKWLFCLCGIVHKCITVFGRGGACVPARVALQGRIRLSSLRTMRVFLVWRRRYADVRAGTQAPPLRFRLGRLRFFGGCLLGKRCT